MLGSVRDIARTLLALAETRTRLAANELEEQALRFAEIAIWAAVAFFFFGVTLVFVAIVALLLFWDTHPGLVAGVIALVFLAAGTGGALMVRLRLRERPKLLEATVAEFAKDRERMARRPADPSAAPKTPDA
jgi:uncharacterized membrane protein YqjE